METWKAVPGFEAYDVSSEGRFRGKRGMLTVTEQDNYLRVGLRRQGRSKIVWAALMVAKAFHDTLAEDVDYLDGDKTNIAAANLRPLRKRRKQRQSKVTEKEARDIQRRYDAGESPKSILKDFGKLSYSGVMNICRRHAWDDGNAPRAKKSRERLTDEQILDIRKRFADGESINSISKTVPVSRQAVGNIVKRRSYAWIK